MSASPRHHEGDEDASLEVPVFILDSWYTHLKGSINRLFGQPQQRGPPQDLEQLFGWIISAQRQGDPAYVSARPYLGRCGDAANISMGTVYLDFDSKDDPGRAVWEAALCYDMLERNGVIPRVYFSGMKGCALYIDCMEPDLPHLDGADTELKKRVLRRVVDGLARQGYRTLDVGASSDLKRISRLPNTLHPTSGLYCIPLRRSDLDRGIEEIRDLAAEPRDLTIEILDSNEFHVKLSKLGLIVHGEMERERAFSALRPPSRAYRGLGDAYCRGVTLAMNGVREGQRELAALGLRRFFERQQLDHVTIGLRLREWNRNLDSPLDGHRMRVVLSREVRQSFCYFLNLAGLCPDNCPRLSKRAPTSLKDNHIGTNSNKGLSDPGLDLWGHADEPKPNGTEKQIEMLRGSGWIDYPSKVEPSRPAGAVGYKANLTPGGDLTEAGI